MVQSWTDSAVHQQRISLTRFTSNQYRGRSLRFRLDGILWTFCAGCWISCQYFHSYIHRVIVPTSNATINNQERRDLQKIGDLFDTLRKTITRTKPTNTDMKSIVSILDRLSTVLRPYFVISFTTLVVTSVLWHRSVLCYCPIPFADLVDTAIAKAFSTLLRGYFKGVVDLNYLIKILLDYGQEWSLGSLGWLLHKLGDPLPG